MTSKGNKRIQHRAANQGRSGVVVLALVLAMSAFGLWRCMEADDGPLSPADTEGLSRRVVIGRGAQVDTTIVEEQALLREASKPAPHAKGNTPAKPGTPKAQPAAAKPAGPEVKAKPAPVPEPPRFPLHAVAFQFHSQVRDRPDSAAKVVGYARRGATFRVSEKVRGPGCEKGWHEIEPGGYFVCAGLGVIVGKEPVSFAPSPTRPRLDADLPYDYRYVAADEAIQYWKAPTSEEELAAKAALDQAEANGESLDRDALAAVLAKARAMGTEQVEAPPAEPAAATDGSGTDSNTPSSGVPTYVHTRLRKGFFVSADGAQATPSGSFARTVRGRFVRSERLTTAKPSSFAGVLLGRSASALPMGFVVGSGAQFLSRAANSAPLKAGAEASRYQRLTIGEPLDYKGKRYYEVGSGRYLAAKVVAVVRQAKLPADLAPYERWIDIDLAEQTLVAYEGERPVFATLVSTGRPGYETPTGTFRIYGKHVTITMDDTAAGDESYSIEDVPWTQFFKDSFALHAAFWHDRFGRVRSHGCVNLSPADARRLFRWTGPEVPAGLHGVISSKDNPGTRVVIH